MRTPLVPAPASGRVPSAGPVKVAPPAYERRYAQAAVLVDLTALGAALALHRIWGEDPQAPYARLYLGAGVLAVALGTLLAGRAWERRILGQGTEEFNRLLRAFCWLGVLIAVAGLASKTGSLRPYAFGVVPSAFGLAIVGRWSLRRPLHRLRGRGRCMRNVLAVGSDEAVAELITRTRRAAHTGWRVTAACVPSGPRLGSNAIHDVPIVGDLDSISATVQRFGHHVVAVSPTQGWNPRRLHTLAWDLEGSGVTVVVDPGLMEIAGPRVRIDTLDGVPMLRLSEPTFTGATRLIKNASDFFGAALLLLLSAPLMVVIAVAIKCHDGGSVFYRQQRIGRGESTFCMLKFRTMTVGAHALVEQFRELDQGAGPMFKMTNDPRLTAVGLVLRRFSLDELPQLWNVLRGSMSLVGPRPPLPAEVASYDREARRRLLVKPGMTGLWQVSGRSDLGWEESVRLDRRYVENWTLLLDASIIWKTLGAVFHGSGAY